MTDLFKDLSVLDLNIDENKLGSGGVWTFDFIPYGHDPDEKLLKDELSNVIDNFLNSCRGKYSDSSIAGRREYLELFKVLKRSN